MEGTGARAGELATGEPLTARWQVTVPRDAAFGYTPVPVTATYRVPGAGADAPALRVRQAVRVFVHPPGVRYASDLPFTAETNGWGPAERDRSNGEQAAGDGGPLRIGGTTYDKGVGVHADADITLELAGSYERFTAHTGVDDEVSAAGSVVFEVIGDGTVLARSGVLRSAPEDDPELGGVTVSIDASAEGRTGRHIV
ncbi:NPCBM/NEW2 domain-containing protein, partial [Streptomyces sp. NPDC048845]|uniref:NPCBM/NEW2 domain-containing protein n=1 Tax=Streptomyces sp. NPDC048845 TaxID=3155390 RepID=UPI0034204385